MSWAHFYDLSLLADVVDILDQEQLDSAVRTLWKPFE